MIIYILMTMVLPDNWSTGYACRNTSTNYRCTGKYMQKTCQQGQICTHYGDALIAKIGRIPDAKFFDREINECGDKSGKLRAEGDWKVPPLAPKDTGCG
jgi:hypothetical protein